MQPPDARPPVDRDVDGVLRDVFGYGTFRPHQREIVNAILAGRDVFAVMPTGGGKSLCYQLPAHVLPGVCLVVSPLISLMKDQVDGAAATGLRAACLNSAQDAAEQREVTRRLLAGDLDLVYVSPERFAMPAFEAMLARVRLSFAAIDEAHCISEWGHDFRPDYLGLAAIATRHPDVPVTAFTATATRRVQEDIERKLGLRSPLTVRASFDRPNLFYRVTPKDRPGEQILRFVRDHRGEPGIVYRTTRADVEKTAAMLDAHGVRALPYHAGLEPETRKRNQDAFNRDEIEIIVATIAFGMGIDKSNVRFIVHGDLPKNVESYYQETGRAGRDGDPADCLLLFGYGDIPRIRFFIDQVSDDDERNHAIRCLNDMIHFATACACRRRQLLAYFGEEYPRADCGACDVCAGEVETIDATRDAQIVLSAIARTGERFGAEHIVNIVAGADTERIRALGHDRIKTYGVGSDRDRRHWRRVIDNLLVQQILTRTTDGYPVLRFLPEARAVLSGETSVPMLKVHAPKPKRRPTPARDAIGAIEGPADEALFESLRALRRELAAARHVPPYVVFTDRALREMASRRPSTEEEFLEINGVGTTKLARYGAAFLARIRNHADSLSST